MNGKHHWIFRNPWYFWAISIVLAFSLAACESDEETVPKTLSSISLSPGSAAMTLNASQQFTASGTYSDSSTQTLTTGLTWSSSDTSTAVVNSSGVATGIALGDVTITATDTESGFSSAASLSVIEISQPTLDMGFPASMTGNEVAIPQGSGGIGPLSHGGPHCFFEGHGGGDPFGNGHSMTRFLVSTIKTWTCFADFIMAGVVLLPIPIGTFLAIPPDPLDPDAPTGILITQDSATQMTVGLYFGGTTDVTGNPGAYLSWNNDGTAIEGRLVLAGQVMNSAADPEAPAWLRMDFTIGVTQRSAELVVAWPTANTWVEAFRVTATKILADNSFEVQGIMGMKAQWDASYPGAEVPTIAINAVADAIGDGAAWAQMNDLAFGFPLPPSETLGYFLLQKTDKYYFLSDGSKEWMEKTFTGASHAGGESVSALTIIVIESALGLTNTELSNCIGGTAADCLTFFDALFALGYGGDVVVNDPGAEPTDGRFTTLSGMTYLTSPCPADAASCTYDETGVFQMAFTPSG